MRRLFVLFGFVLSMSLLTSQTVAAQSPVVPAPMTPIAVWPPAVPNAPGSSENQATTPPQPTVNTSVTSTQVSGLENLGLGGSTYSSSGDQISLAEAAREARQRLAKDHPRMFTNDDVARLRQAAGEPPLGVAPAGPPATSQQTMPASDQPATPGMQDNEPASGQTAPAASSNQAPAKRSPFRPKQ